VAPLLAPIIGSALLPLGWQAIFVLKACYGIALLALYTVLVGETRPGSFARLSLRAVFEQCRSVVGERVEGRRLPIRYAAAMAFSTSVMMIFVTNVSFIYMEYFGVPASRFPLFFGMSVLGFMSLNLFSMKRLGNHNADRFFRYGLGIQICAVTGLLVVTLTRSASLATTVPLLVVTVATLGLVGPAGSARYMSFFKELAGSASSVYMTMVFFLGGTLGALTGVFYDGTLLPIVAMMFAASCTANVIGWTLPFE
jgi:DHA1 family bicyclomycin/chloramphenicol resistance-like MFS transporter